MTDKKKIRLIARLDVKDVNLVKGIQLEGLRKLGDPNAFARRYYEQGIDELLYIDIVASLYNRNNLSDIVEKTSENVFIPITVGGGLRSVEDVRHILSMGADKAAINTAAIKRPALITEVAEAFGSQCMVLSIQAKRSRTQSGKWEAYYDNGRQHSGLDVIEWAKRGEALGAGEILLMKDGQIAISGVPGEIISSMPETVWQCSVPREKADEYLRAFKVANIKTVPGGMELRIISPGKPTPDAVPTEPTLEDVFLYYFGERAGEADGTL